MFFSCPLYRVYFIVSTSFFMSSTTPNLSTSLSIVAWYLLSLSPVVLSTYDSKNTKAQSLNLG